MRIIAFLLDPPVICKILDHIAQRPGRPRAPPVAAGVATAAWPLRGIRSRRSRTVGWRLLPGRGAQGPVGAPRLLGRAARSDHKALQGFEIAFSRKKQSPILGGKAGASESRGYERVEG
jgi:hypothetical protein